MSMINCYCFDGGGGGGGGDDMMTVLALNHSGLLAFFPILHQRHGGVVAEILQDSENEIYKNKITRGG